MQIVCYSSCDLLGTELAEMNVAPVIFPYSLNGEEQTEMFKTEEDYVNFYTQIRSGKTPKTSGINAFTYEELFTPFLEKGEDILYIHLSSGLTGTFNYAQTVIDDLKQKFPTRKVIFVDSLQVSFGVAELVKHAVRLRDAGRSIDQIAQELNILVPKIATYFIPENLFYLQKGGRISMVAAIGGTLLNVKPVIKVTDEGKLQKVGVVAGRKAAIKKLASVAISNLKNSDLPIGVMHACSKEDALQIKAELEQALPGKIIELHQIGPTIGTYCGPGTLGIIFNTHQR